MKKFNLVLFFMLMSIGWMIAQTKVSGIVISADDGEPIIGATIKVKGTQLGTVTDADGEFTINVPNKSSMLQFSYVGMESKTEQAKTSMRVILNPTTQALDEVMVVAYGTSKKSSFTGSANVVKADQIEKIQTASFTKALEGVSAGVQVTGGTGQPGSGAAIRIRGIGSVNASSSPLYVVDGAAYDGDINAINTDDIESITVLKDAASAALYGARGANGVIMVTTKKGKKGQSTVSAKINLGIASRGIAEYDRVDIPTYYELQWEGWRNALVKANNYTPEAAAALASGGTRNGIVGKLGGYNSYNVANDQLIGLDGKINPNAMLLYADDWNKELAKNALRQDYNLSVSGGTNASSYFISLGYLNEEGVVKWSNFDRLTARVAVNSEVTKWFNVDASISGSRSTSAGFLAEGTYTSNPFYYGRMMAPIYPIWQRNADGSIKQDPNGAALYDMGGGNTAYTWAGHTRAYAPNSNLMVTLPLDDRSNEKNQISARFSGEFSFLKDFKLRISGNADIANTYYTTYQNNMYGDAAAVSGRSTKEYEKLFSYTFNQVLSWSRGFGDHNLSALAGHENYWMQSRNLWATRTGFTIPTSELVAGSVAEGSSSYSDEYTLEGWFLQANYDYANKYYASASFRRDGSSRFHKDARWGSFWSLGASWRLNQEDFMSDTEWIDNLKIKASYGEQGNDNINNYYGYQSLYSIDDRNNGNLNGAWHSQLPNPSLKWEKNGNFNVGVEFGFWERLSGEVEFFNRKSDNLLFNVPLPESTGISKIWRNVGAMYNRGFEIQLGGDIITNENFKWRMDLNATTYRNKITKLPKDQNGKYQEIIDGTKKLSVGHSIYDFWLRDWAGVDPADGSALYYVDLTDADGTVTRSTTKDQNKASYYYCGSAIPDLYGGYTNTLTWKGFDLSIFFTYQIGGKMYDSNYASLMHPGSFGSHMHKDIMNRWTAEGQVTDVPRLQNNYTAASAASSRWLTDASFLSLRNLTLGYNLPASVLRKLQMKNCRIYASGDNLFLFSKRKGMDPQQTFNGTSDFTYVPNRIVSFGLNVSF